MGNIGKERDTVCTHGDDLLTYVPYELDKYAIDKELQHVDDFALCIAPLALCFINDKIGDSKL